MAAAVVHCTQCIATKPRQSLDIFPSIIIMLDSCNSLHNLDMWLSVQYWEMFYSDWTEDETDNLSGWPLVNVKGKRVTFSDKDEVNEVQTEYQFYKTEVPQQK